MATPKRPVLVFSDTHAPFAVDGAIDFLRDTYKKEGCGSIVCAGDLFDHHSMSFHTTETDAMGMSQERVEALKFVGELCRAFPKGTLVLGNHDKIPTRKAKEAGIPRGIMIQDKELYGLSRGWMVEPRHHVIFGESVCIAHGTKSSGQYGCVNTAKKIRSSYVQGHIHAHPMVKYSQNFKNKVFGMNVGCLFNESSYAARYGEEFAEKGVHGCGVVYGPEYAQFIPMRGN